MRLYSFIGIIISYSALVFAVWYLNEEVKDYRNRLNKCISEIEAKEFSNYWFNKYEEVISETGIEDINDSNFTISF